MLLSTVDSRPGEEWGLGAAGAPDVETEHPQSQSASTSLKKTLPGDRLWRERNGRCQ